MQIMVDFHAKKRVDMLKLGCTSSKPCKNLISQVKHWEVLSLHGEQQKLVGENTQVYGWGINHSFLIGKLLWRRLSLVIQQTVAKQVSESMLASFIITPIGK